MASKIGQAFAGKTAPSRAEEEMSVDDESAGDSEDAELSAMKAFLSAKSPEDKVQALKLFLEACGAIGYQEDEGDASAGMELPPDLGF